MTRSRYLAALAVVAITAGFSAPRADAALAERAHARAAHATPAHASLATTQFGDCWASPNGPYHTGNTVQADLGWQCNGAPQQMQIYVTLTSAVYGTRYTASRTCYNVSDCAVSLSGPWVSGEYGDSWTLKAEYIYVVAGDGSSHYEYGPAWTVIF